MKLTDITLTKQTQCAQGMPHAVMEQRKAPPKGCTLAGVRSSWLQPALWSVTSYAVMEAAAFSVRTPPHRSQVVRDHTPRGELKP